MKIFIALLAFHCLPQATGSKGANVRSENGLTTSTVGVLRLGGTLNQSTVVQQALFPFSFMNGKVGINTLTPNYALHVNGAGSSAWVQVSNTASGTGGNDGLFFGVSGAGQSQIWSKGDLNFIVDSGITNNNSVTFKSTGFVGVGTTLPSAVLHVNKAIVGTGVGLQSTTSNSLTGNSQTARGLNISMTTAHATGTTNNTATGVSNSISSTGDGSASNIIGISNSVANSINSPSSIGNLAGIQTALTKSGTASAPAVYGLRQDLNINNSGTSITFGTSNTTVVASGANVSQILGDRVQVATNSTGGSQIQTRRTFTQLNATGGATTSWGHFNDTTSTAGFSGPTVYGEQIQQSLNANHTTAYGLFVNQLGTGTVFGSYGVYVSTLTGINKWAFYASDSTARNYFAGNTGVGAGVSVPANTFQVGTASVANTAGIRLPITSGSANDTSTAYLAVNSNGDMVKGATIPMPTSYSGIAVISATPYTITNETVLHKTVGTAMTLNLPTCASGRFVKFVNSGGGTITYSPSILSNGSTVSTRVGVFKQELTCVSGTWVETI